MMEMRGWQMQQEDGPLASERRGSIWSKKQTRFKKISVCTAGMADIAKGDRVFIVLPNTECAESNPSTGNPATVGLRP